MDIKPKKKRAQSEDDSFVMSSSQGGGRRARQSSDKLAPESLQFAELMGFDTSDPEVVKRLQSRAKTVRHIRK